VSMVASRSLSTLLRVMRDYGVMEGFAVLTSPSAGGGRRIECYLEPFSCFVGTDSLARTTTSTETRESEGGDLVPALEAWISEGEGSVSVCALSYEFLHHFERVPRPEAQPQVPDVILFRYAAVLRYDEGDDTLTLSRTPCRETPFWRFEEKAGVEVGREEIEAPSPARMSFEEISAALEACAVPQRDQYLDGVRSIQTAIAHGLVYQVNFARRFELPYTAPAIDLFTELLTTSPSPYSGFLSFHYHGSAIAYVSASPELFFELDGQTARCCPIKGTRRRGASEEEDRALQDDLERSEKDRAELAMIVDLVRNDLGRVAMTGSVHVPFHARVHTFESVHHLVSEVRATVPESVPITDLLSALFPCGSITGAPKIAAMEHIAALERAPRGIFTGALGMLSGTRSARFNVAIRTGTVMNGTLVFHAGGGIVIDSSPEAEYDETVAKASNFYRVWSRLTARS
jgi:para-aminobenzoate synthetase component I